MSRQIQAYSIMIASLAYDEGREFGAKTRPAFVLKYDGEIISYFKITSKFENKSKYFQEQYFEVKDWVQANLRSPSWIDTYEIKEVEDKYVKVSIIGYLSKNDEGRLIKFLKEKRENR